MFGIWFGAYSLLIIHDFTKERLKLIIYKYKLYISLSRKEEFDDYFEIARNIVIPFVYTGCLKNKRYGNSTGCRAKLYS
jgi:hypothetical protein